MDLGQMMLSLWESTGMFHSQWQNYVMLLVSFVLFYLAIARKFEPLLLVPIAFGMLLSIFPERTTCCTRRPRLRMNIRCLATGR